MVDAVLIYLIFRHIKSHVDKVFRNDCTISRIHCPIPNMEDMAMLNKKIGGTIIEKDRDDVVEGGTPYHGMV